MVPRSHILVADAHPLFRRALRLAVDHVCAGAEFVEASSSDELLNLTGHDERFDLIVVDLMMAAGNEFQELAALRRRVPLTPTIVVSSREDRETVQRALECGIAGYIPKSASMSATEGAIARVLAGGTYVPDGIPGATSHAGATLAGETLAALTPRQRAVLERLALGASNRQIASDLCIEEITVKAHISAILRKFRVKNRLQAVVAFKSFL
jgi:DNA-binding NarL/FixJ family response regulator